MDDIKNSLILTVFKRIKMEQLPTFQRWSEALMAGDEAVAEELLPQLLNAPVRSLS